METLHLATWPLGIEVGRRGSVQLPCPSGVTLVCHREARPVAPAQGSALSDEVAAGALGQWVGDSRALGLQL